MEPDAPWAKTKGEGCGYVEEDEVYIDIDIGLVLDEEDAGDIEVSLRVI